MNCSLKEFIDRVRAKHPAKYDWVDYDTNGTFHVFFLDTAVECQKIFNDKLKIASHVWQEDIQTHKIPSDGTVIKDVDGIFAPQTIHFTNNSTGPINITLPTASNQGRYRYWINYDTVSATADRPDVDKPKCTCGGWSVGATKHPKYCDLFELEST